MAVEQFPAFQQNESFSAAITRRAIHAILARDGSSDVGSIAGGVVGATDCAVTAPVSGMSINVAVGEAMVGGTSTTTQSGYYVFVSSTTNVAISTSDPTNPRIDVPCLTVTDIAYGAGADAALAQVIKGTAAGSPFAPSLPATSLALAHVAVAAGATNIVTGNITDERVTVKLGISATITAAAIEATFTALNQIYAGTGSGTGQVVTPDSNLQILSSLLGLSGQDKTTTQTVTTTVTLPSPSTCNRLVLTLTSGDNLVITGWASPVEGQWMFIDIHQPASGTTTNTVSWTGSTFVITGGTKPTMSTGASVYDSYAVKYKNSKYELMTLGQNPS